MIRVLSIAALGVALALSSSTTLAGGDPAKGKAKSVLCAACHGLDGNSPNPMWPNLAGQHEAYLAKQIRDFKSGARKDPQMAPMVAALTEEDIENIAAYFASQTQK